MYFIKLVFSAKYQYLLETQSINLSIDFNMTYKMWYYYILKRLILGE